MRLEPEAALPDLLAARAAAAPDRRFLTLTTGGARSYGDMARASARIAGGLARLGLGRGDRLLLMLPNSAEFVEAWFAAARLGAVIVPVNTGLLGPLLAHVVNDSGAALIVAGAEFLPALEAIRAECPGLGAVVVVGEAETGLVPFAQLAEAPEAPCADLALRDPGAILYTSGTTGRSKGVVMPHGQLRANPEVYIGQLGLTAEDRLFACLPLFHANALLLGVYGALLLGTEIVVAPRFSASDWARQIRAHGVTATNLLGVMVEFVLKQPPAPEDAENRLRVATAAPLSPGLGDRFEARFGVKLIELYGSTELNVPIYHPLDAPRRPRSCGRAVEERFECRLVDPVSDEEAPDGAAGELVVRPRRPFTTMLGYHNRPDATAAAWRNLWFHTGDIMRRDADGYFYFVDRAKDAIRRRGENVSSFEVEEALLRHDAVLEAAVIGVPSPYEAHEQEVKACIVLRPGAAAEAAALADFCRGLLPDFARPRFIEIMPALPKTPTEKVRKDALRAAGITPETWADPEAGRRKGAHHGA